MEKRQEEDLQLSLTNNSLHSHLEVPLDITALIDDGDTMQQWHRVQQVTQVKEPSEMEKMC